MPITEGEWASISALIQRHVGFGGKNHYFTAEVIKTDPANKLIWVKELGSQAIPLVGLDYDVKYYDTDGTGAVTVRNARISPAVPSVGDPVFIVLELGSHSLPRCLGVIQGTNWRTREDETGFGGDV